MRRSLLGWMLAACWGAAALYAVPALGEEPEAGPYDVALLTLKNDWHAIRYNRPGGFVLLVTDAPGDLARVRVENTGPPVAPDAAARLAEPFERLGRGADSRGAGLGLSIVRAICSAHGGSLSIEPRPRGGLDVQVSLPTAGGARATGTPAGRAPAQV